MCIHISTTAIRLFVASASSEALTVAVPVPRLYVDEERESYEQFALMMCCLGNILKVHDAGQSLP